MITDPPWRRAREVLDAYDDDRVVSEQLADDLVNDLAGRGPGGRPRRRASAGRTADGSRAARPRLTVVGGTARVSP